MRRHLVVVAFLIASLFAPTGARAQSDFDRVTKLATDWYDQYLK